MFQLTHSWWWSVWLVVDVGGREWCSSGRREESAASWVELSERERDERRKTRRNEEEIYVVCWIFQHRLNDYTRCRCCVWLWRAAARSWSSVMSIVSFHSRVVMATWANRQHQRSPLIKRNKKKSPHILFLAMSDQNSRKNRLTSLCNKRSSHHLVGRRRKGRGEDRARELLFLCSPFDYERAQECDSDFVEYRALRSFGDT